MKRGKTQMNVLVTGGAGFLGKYVVELIKGCHVVDNFDPRCGGTNEPNVIAVDVRDFESLEAIILSLKISHIIHLAAYGRNLTCQKFPHDAWNVNVVGTFNVLEVARKHPHTVKRVVCASSNIVLSDQKTVYKQTKLAVEKLVKLYSSYGVSCMGLRPSNIYGRGQSKKEYQPCAFAGLDKSYAENGHFVVTGDGTQSRDWVHAADVADAFLLALSSSFSGKTIDVCTGKLTSINEVAQLLRVPIKYTEARPGDAKQLVSDPEEAKNILGFVSKRKLEQTVYEAFPEVMKASM
jgi:UDP-glucose 4-epimerase